VVQLVWYYGHRRLQGVVGEKTRLGAIWWWW
jgi:hypothetical protein